MISPKITPKPGMTLTPTVSLSGVDYGARLSINDVQLTGIGRDMADASKGTNLTHHIDYAEINGPIEGLTLTITLTNVNDSDDLIIALAVEDPSKPKSDGQGAVSDTDVLTLSPVSQMEYDDPDLRQRICCPTCVTMLANYYGRSMDLGEMAEKCYCPQVDLYGVWPQAIYTANQYGLSGYCYRFDSFDQASDLINRGIPIIASLAYYSGGISNAVVEKTEGHLVVLAGINGDQVTVYDPAASRADQVKRHYDPGEFITAWFNHGGLGIIIFE
jgi:hypothetical protein